MRKSSTFQSAANTKRSPAGICTHRKKTRSLKTSAAGTAIGTLLILLAPPVEAANLTFVSDRAALGGSDRVDWSILGSVQPPFKVLPNSFSVTSEQGLGVNISIPQAATPGVTPPLLFQTLPSPGIPTNFASGDFILLTGLIPSIVLRILRRLKPLKSQTKSASAD
ncbi:hypothetical protein [Oscillatoria nigro-viridis]|uniref:hypothetical protein n=1 Tax=Phormidium nigroviride TaxID=482564 RepID=UPI0006852824|nr:hypothetical protein [Oscillatoria nigro-viridis]